MEEFNLTNEIRRRADVYWDVLGQESVQIFIDQLKTQIFGTTDEYLPKIHTEEINKRILKIINKLSGNAFHAVMETEDKK